MTKDQFKAATGLTDSMVARWYEPVENAMFEFAIVSPERAAHFLAQVGHESGGFKWTAEIWGPTAQQKTYDFREDLGNTQPEAIAIAAEHGSTPGRWWAGHGILQVTGYYNHMRVGKRLGLDLAHNPGQLKEPFKAARSAGVWWEDNNMNELIDSGASVLTVSRAVNLGNPKSKKTPNGLADRQRRYDLAAPVLGAA